ncbi:MAG: hypothetical protein ACHQSE_13905 [Gemmatimonadales bacterium]
MLLTRPTNRSLVCAIALALAASACGERPGAKKPDVTPADVVAGSAQSFDHFVSPEGKFAVDFPPVWAGNYTGTPHADTTYGSHFILEFRFKPNPAWKVQPQTLLAIRTFTSAAWAKTSARPGPAIGVKIQEHGNDVYVLSLAGSNPYKVGTDAAALFDKMMLAVMQDPVPLRVTPR